jgi:hypothetical protein
MTCNRVSGIRCALCWNEVSARLSREHNDANVLSLGARMVSEEEAFRIVNIWMETPFEGGRHVNRIRMIDQPAASSPRPSPGEGVSDGTEKEDSLARAVENARPANEYDVVVSFRYLIYWEGDRSIEFQVNPGLKQPTVIRVASAEKWDQEMPDWARGRRKEIMERIGEKCAHFPHEFKD